MTKIDILRTTDRSLAWFSSGPVLDDPTSNVVEEKCERMDVKTETYNPATLTRTHPAHAQQFGTCQTILRTQSSRVIAIDQIKQELRGRLL